MTTYSQEYGKRLRDWNASEKYLDELRLLHSLMPMKRPLKVLDYGCGIGTAIKYLSERMPQAQVYGYDPIRHDPRVVDDFYIRSEFYFQFDVCYLMHVVAHLPDKWDSFRAIKQVLKPDGKLVIITPNADWLTIKNGKSDHKSDKTVIQHYCLKDLKWVMNIAGFDVEMSGQYGERLEDQSERIFLVAKNR